MRPSAFPGEKLSAPGLFCYCVALQAANIRQALASHCCPHSATKLSTSCKIGKCRGKVGRVQSKHCAQLSTPRPCLYHVISLAAGVYVLIIGQLCTHVCVCVREREREREMQRHSRSRRACNKYCS